MFAQHSRLRNRAGFPIQNPEAYACNSCRDLGRICYGYKEHPNRKCIPCAKFDLECSKEDVYVHRGPGTLERVPDRPKKAKLTEEGLERKTISSADRMALKHHVEQRIRNVPAPVPVPVPVSASVATRPTIATVDMGSDRATVAATTSIARTPEIPIQPTPQKRARGRFGGQKRDWMK